MKDAVHVSAGKIQFPLYLHIHCLSRDLPEFDQHQSLYRILFGIENTDVCSLYINPEEKFYL